MQGTPRYDESRTIAPKGVKHLQVPGEKRYEQEEN